MPIRKILLYVILGIVVVVLAIVTAPLADHANSWMKDPAVNQQIDTFGQNVGRTLVQFIFGR